MAKNSDKITVTSEVGTLRRLLVHSPDSGLGKVVPSKAQDWLFEDIVHLETIRRHTLPRGLTLPRSRRASPRRPAPTQRHLHSRR